MMPIFLKRFFILTLSLRALFFSALSADEFAFEDSSPAPEPIHFELISEQLSIQPATPFWVAISVTLDDHWHTYWKYPGDLGMPLRVEWNLPLGYTASDLTWPFPQKFEQNGFVGFGFEQNLTLLAKITPPAQTPLDENIDLKATISWLVCSDQSCLPGQTELETRLFVKHSEAQTNIEAIALFKNARQALPSFIPKITAELVNDKILLQIPLPAPKTIDSAYFCPNTKNVVDIKSDIVIEAIDTDVYQFSLKTDQINDLTALQGALVIESNGHQEAIEINLPLFMTDMIAYVNPPPLFANSKESVFLNDQKTASDPMEFEGGIAMALLFAFLGGMILNLMPCVLPVLSFKVLSFVKMAGQSRALVFKHGLAFTGGVLVSFWVLAGFMLLLQSYGESVGWGFQLQEPLFVGILAAFLLLFSLSLFGVFEMGASVTAWAGSVNTARQSSALTGSFFSGILATAVATPCTGPFLGSAIGFAVTLPAFWALLIFTSLGLGMAFPYLLLAGFPALLRFMPKPGAWMEVFKELLGFVMLATVLWLVWVFAAQTSALSIFMLLLSFFILAIGAWIYGRWGSIVNTKNTRIISTLIAAICIGAAVYIVVLSASPALLAKEESATTLSDDGWENFSQARVDELQTAGIPVLIDFTAKWCLICQTNHLILSMNAVEQAMQLNKVVKMKADWTKNDPDITKALKQFGRSGVPLYVLYGADANTAPTILPQVLTPDAVIAEIEKIYSPIVTN